MRAAFVLAFCLPLALTGCTLSPTTSDTSPEQGLSIQGAVHGGQQPIVGAHIYLFAAGTGGYGTTSTSLLTNVPGSTTIDGSGNYYVTSVAPNGTFSISGDYSCTANTPVYLYAVGGNPGLPTPPPVNNTASGLLAILGNCPNTGNFASATPFVYMDEVSTVAAAYAFAGFATDATHVASSGTALAKIGIQNAFSNAANLADLASGTALDTPPNNPLGVSPQANVNTLANILASCVNTNGTISGPTNPTPCYTLLNNAKNGSVVPSDTATAAINIAHNPGANITALFGLSSSNPPFGPALTSAPNDFTLGLQLTSNDMSAPQSVAIDGSGNAWVANSQNNSVTEISSSGSVLSGSNGFTGGGLVLPDGIAIDPSGNAWATNFSSFSVTEFNSSGTPTATSPYSIGSPNEPNGIAIDGFGNAWISNQGGNSVSEITPGGASVTTYTSGLTLSSPRGVAIDGSENVWIASTVNSAVAELHNNGAVVSSGYTGGSLNKPYAIAIDGEGDAWVPNYGSSTTTSTVTELSNSLSPVTGSPFSEGGAYGPQGVAIDGGGNAWIADKTNNSVTEFSSSGVMVSPSTGYNGSSSIAAPVSIGVDGSGNVWVANNGSSTLTEVIGAGTPVVTPLSLSVKNNTLGARP